MSRVDVGFHEPIDKALRRLKKKLEREGTLKTVMARKHYEKPSEEKRRKKRATISKMRKLSTFPSFMSPQSQSRSGPGPRSRSR